MDYIVRVLREKDEPVVRECATLTDVMNFINSEVTFADRPETRDDGLIIQVVYSHKIS